MDCRDRGSHARGVCPAQDTSRMGTARRKQEEAETRIITKEKETDARIIAKEEEEMWKKGLRVRRGIVPNKT